MLYDPMQPYLYLEKYAAIPSKLYVLLQRPNDIRPSIQINFITPITSKYLKLNILREFDNFMIGIRVCAERQELLLKIA